MNWIDLITRSGRSLRNAKMRTILTSLAIAVGAFTLTLTLAAGNGVREYTDRLVANNFDPAESIVGRDKEVENTGAPNAAPKEYDDSIGSVTVGGDGSSLQIQQITDKDIESLRKLPYVEQVRPNYQLAVRYITRDDQKRYTLSAQAYNPGQKPELVVGGIPASGDLPGGSVLLPESYVSLLGFGSPENAIGKTVQISTVRSLTVAGQLLPEERLATFTVNGVIKPSAASIAVTGLPVMLSGGDVRDLYAYTAEGTQNYGKYTYAFVRVKDGADEAVSQKAKADLKSRGYYVQTSQDIQKTITQFVDVLQILVGVFGVITVIASIFGIVNTMYISVLERTREIGLMKALGMRGSDVSWLFRIEAAWIGFLGGVIGAVGAIALGMSLNPWITAQLDLGEGNAILLFDYTQICILIGALIVVAIVAGWLPARKAAKLDPIEALRTE